MADWIGSAITGGTGLLSGLFNGPKKQDKYNAKSQQRQYEYQSALNAQAQQYNMETMAQENRYAVENWLMQQEYNSPENQLKRVQEAGLNPNLVMGQSNVTNASNSAPSTPSGNSPSGGSADALTVDVGRNNNLQRAFENATKALMTSLQYGNISADTEIKKQNARILAQQQVKQAIENKMAADRLKVNPVLLDLEVKHAQKNLDKIDQDIATSQANEKNLLNSADAQASQANHFNELSGKVVYESLEAEARWRYEKWRADYVEKYNQEPPKNVRQRVFNDIVNGLEDAFGEIKEVTKNVAPHQSYMFNQGFRPGTY